MKKTNIILMAGLILIVFGALNLFTTKSVLKPNLNIDPDTLAGIQTTDYPWQPEINNLQTRLSQIGLPALTAEGTAVHTHQHLDIFVNGNQIPLPANIGNDDAKGFIAPIHSHDETGIIHVESPVVQKFYLGQFFDIWGVRLTQTCIGGYCNTNNKSLRVFVNGVLLEGDPRTIELLAHQEIAVTYGTISDSPFPVPSSFDFPIGY